jgi:transaldolase
MAKNPLQRVSELGQSIWFDNIQRDMLQNGDLKRMISADGLRGITSNPTIFQKAITSSKAYEGAIGAKLASNPKLTAREMFYELAIEDIQAACDAFRDVYTSSQGRDGMVSIEVSPELAYDSQGTIKEARELHKRVGRSNVMIKVPATKEGLPAVEALIADGINVNVTLLFSVERYREVTEAYLKGLESRHARKLPISTVASVASFFVSRVDSAVDKLLDEQIRGASTQADGLRQLLGKAAIANAKLAYRVYKHVFHSSRFAMLKKYGAQTQRLLWASTGTKNPNYSDVMYLDTLIGPDTVNTVPPTTYNAFRDHGQPALTLESDEEKAEQVFKALSERRIDIKNVTEQLENEGVASFADSFRELLNAIDVKLQTLGRSAIKAS